MRILIDIGHPAHVHLFKNAAWELEKRGHSTFWAVRRKDVVVDLMEQYQFEYAILTSAQKGMLGLAKELIEHNYKIFRLVRRLKPDVMIGTSPSITHVGTVTRVPSIVFNEDDRDAVKIFAALSYPLADTICTPDCLRDDMGKKHVTYRGYHELAYLYPGRFTPNVNTLGELGLTPGDRFFVVRFVALEASHDVGESGIDVQVRRKLVQMLSDHGRLIISSEKELLPEFEPYRMPLSPEKLHDLLFYATLCVADSQTMTAEAAVLGTPAFRSNTFVGRISYLEELEHTYGLTYGFHIDDQGGMLSKIAELLREENLKEKWERKRRHMLEDKIDVTDWMVRFIEDYPESFLEYKRSRERQS